MMEIKLSEDKLNLSKAENDHMIVFCLTIINYGLYILWSRLKYPGTFQIIQAS